MITYKEKTKQNKTKGSSIVEVAKSETSKTTSSFENGVRTVLGLYLSAVFKKLDSRVILRFIVASFYSLQGQKNFKY